MEGIHSPDFSGVVGTGGVSFLPKPLRIGMNVLYIGKCEQLMNHMKKKLTQALSTTMADSSESGGSSPKMEIRRRRKSVQLSRS